MAIYIYVPWWNSLLLMMVCRLLDAQPILQIVILIWRLCICLHNIVTVVIYIIKAYIRFWHWLHMYATIFLFFNNIDNKLHPIFRSHPTMLATREDRSYKRFCWLCGMIWNNFNKYIGAFVPFMTTKQACLVSAGFLGQKWRWRTWIRYQFFTLSFGSRKY